MPAQVENGDAASNELGTLPHLESVVRLTKIPIVESALGVATGLYGKVKESNSVLGWTMNHAEVVSSAALIPAASRLGTPLHAMDTLLCKGIDMVEEMVPAVKLPPQKMLDATRNYVTAGLHDPNGGTAVRVINAGMGAATAGLRTAVSAVEWYMDKYLPEQQSEENKENDGVKGADGEIATTEGPHDVMIRLQKVSRRLQRNLLRIASAQIKSFQHQREEATTYAGRMAQYITSAVTHPKEMVSKAGVAWTELVKRLQEEEGNRKAMVQRLAHGIVSILDNARQSLHNIPSDVTSSLDAATKFSASVIGGIFNVFMKSRETEGSNSDEKAKQLCMRQERGTSPLVQQLEPVTKSVVITRDRGSSTTEDQPPKRSTAELNNEKNKKEEQKSNSKEKM